MLARGGLRRQRSLARSLSLGLVIVTLLVACDPIPHPEVTVREAAGSGVRFRLLSGDGNFVVVQASGPGATAPGPGWWRVDRRDGSVVALPDANQATRVSRDGTRVLLETIAGGPVVLWAGGTVLTPPAGARFSDDLTFAVFVDADGTVKTWVAATQAVAPVEPGFPRPPGTTGATAKGISDDGRTVQYTLSRAEPIERFVDLDAGLAVDRPNQSNLTAPDVDDRFVLAANGDAFIHVHQTIDFLDPSSPILLDSWAELVALPGGQSGRRFDNLTTTGQLITDDPLIAVNGKVGWIYADFRQRCSDFPFPVPCVSASTAVAILANGYRTFDTGPNPLVSKDISAHGRFLVFDKRIEPADHSLVPRGPVRVIDWVTGTVETLSQGSPSLTTDAQISDDQRLVATTTNDGGWYEFAAAPT